MGKINLNEFPTKWLDSCTPVIFDDIQLELPKRIGIRKNRVWLDHSVSKVRQMYHYLYRFIPSMVGKSFDNAYSTFCKKYPDWMGGWTNPKREFKRFLGIIEPDSYYSRHNKYYVDDEGIIRKKDIPKKERKKILIKEPLEIRYYLLDRYNNQSILERIKQMFGIKYYEQLVNYGYLLPSQYNRIPYWNIIGYDKSWSRNKNEIFRRYAVYPEDSELEKGTKEYRKYLFEQKNKHRKERREFLLEKKQRNETLLHDLEQRKKIKEAELNIVTRDRLGFDEESFKGEFYHGQKRKKRNSN